MFWFILSSETLLALTLGAALVTLRLIDEVTTDWAKACLELPGSDWYNRPTRFDDTRQFAEGDTLAEPGWSDELSKLRCQITKEEKERVLELKKWRDQKRKVEERCNRAVRNLESDISNLTKLCTTVQTNLFELVSQNRQLDEEIVEQERLLEERELNNRTALEKYDEENLKLRDYLRDERGLKDVKCKF